VSTVNARFLLPLALLLAGGALSVIAVICHRLSDRLFQNRRYLAYLAARLSASIMFFGALLAIPLVLVIIADIFYPGYQLQGDETPGPMGNGGAGHEQVPSRGIEKLGLNKRRSKLTTDHLAGPKRSGQQLSLF
jgi:hypothetical protein